MTRTGGHRHGFQPERYRNFLLVVARVSLRRATHLQAKLDASDIVQDALLQAHVALFQFAGSTDDEFAAWLRGILENKIIDAVRHYGRKKRDAKLEQGLCNNVREASSSFVHLENRLAANRTTPTQALMRAQRALVLAEFLALLPQAQRTALELHLLDERSLHETARAMNRTPASVAGLVRRGLENMRGHLKGKELDLR